MTVEIELLFDASLCVLLAALAAAALHTQRLYTGVVLFVAFGLLLAITWARLGAPDLALAEAAIGAGLTGVLLLAALARSEPEKAPPPQKLQNAGGFILAALVLGVLIRAVWPLADGAVVLPELVNQQLEQSGVEHPVTAVLLNFRAWDTLLELIVLLLALLGVRQLRPAPHALPKPWPILRSWSRLLAPLCVLVAGYVLWRGSHAPGGAFQAGALLAAGAVMLRLTGLLPILRWEQPALRALVLVGAAVFICVAVLGAWFGQGWLNYPRQWAGELILFIEVAATLSIAASLALLVIGDREELGS